MARKHAPRPPRPAPPPPTAAPAPSPATVAAVPPAAVPRLPSVPGPDFGKLAWRVVKSLGSLQLAVVLLTCFVTAMAIGTMVESWYTGKLARDLVYSSWWFVLLLGALFANILCAALKKWPWKRHQTGFLITHLGLLTMLVGGVCTWFNSTDHLMALYDGPEEDGVGPRESRFAIAPEDSDLVVRTGDGKTTTFDFNPGLLPWRSDPAHGFRARTDTLLASLYAIAHPLPQGFSRPFGKDGRIDVVNYFPHARREKYRPAKAGETAVPALKFAIENPMGFELEGWVARPPRLVDPHASAGTRFEQGPSRVEFVGVSDLSPAQEKWFLAPPPPAPKGTLDLELAGNTLRLDVEKALADPTPARLGDWTVRITQYTPDARRPDAAGGQAVSPGLHFELVGPDGAKIDYITAAELAGMKRGTGQNAALIDRMDNDLQVWFHPPDPAFGGSVRGLVQFALRASDKAVLYRSFHTGKDMRSAGELKFETSGTVAVGDDPRRVWEKMDWRLRLLANEPKAYRLPEGEWHWVPENRRPGLEHQKLTAVAQCRVTLGGRTAEVWVPRTEGGGFAFANLGTDRVGVSFRAKRKELPFSIYLERAEQTNDPGTQSAATYTSYVRLTDKEEGIVAAPEVITMNEPLEHRGYKLYQTSYAPLGLDANGKPLNSSTFTVGSDFPGLQLKYLGTAMLAVGIATMFYMRAYFFRPQRRNPPAQAAVPAPEGI